MMPSGDLPEHNDLEAKLEAMIIENTMLHEQLALARSQQGDEELREELATLREEVAVMRQAEAAMSAMNLVVVPMGLPTIR